MMMDFVHKFYPEKKLSANAKEKLVYNRTYTRIVKIYMFGSIDLFDEENISQFQFCLSDKKDQLFP